MAVIPVFLLTILKGKVSVKDPEKRLRYIQSLPDGEYEEVIRKKQSVRSLQQNAYLHAVIFQMIADHTGDSMEDVKSALKIMFLSYTTKSGLRAVKETSRLNTKQLEEFNEKCRIWAAEFLGMYIPLPNEIDVS
jgi:hypothetical protein